MIVTKNLKLYLGSPAELQRPVYVSQGDTGWAFVCTIYSGTTVWEIPDGTTATINGCKPDGTAFSYACEVSGSTVTAPCEEQMTVIPGDVKCELKFAQGGRIIATANFRLVVECSPTGEHRPSETELNALDQALDEVQTIAGQVRAAYGAPRTAASAAEMTDPTLIYVYTGTTGGGYTFGDWYYYDGSAWVSGGAYNSMALELDDTFESAMEPASAKATGDAINAVDTATNARIDTLYSYIGQMTDVEIPAEYQRLDHLESSGEQMILAAPGTQHLTQDTRVRIVFAQTTAGLAVTNYLFGCRRSTSADGFWVTITTSGSIRYGYGSERITPAVITDTDIHILDCDKQNIYLDGVLIDTAPEATFETPSNSRVFAIRGANSGAVYYGHYRVYRYQEWADGAPVADLIPCKRISDNALGMYDLIGERFPENSGSGSFTAGDKWKITPIVDRIDGLSEEIVRIDGDIEELRNQQDKTKPYIITEADRVADKVRGVQTGKTITVAACSDLHFSVDNPTIRAALEDMANGIKKIAVQCHVDFYACFGDLLWRLSTDGDFAKGKQEIIGATKLLNEAFSDNDQIRIVGNHDPNSEGSTGYFSPNQLNAFLGIYDNFLQIQDDYLNQGVGFYDFELQKVRMIVLNTSYYENAPTQGATQYSMGYPQALWLCEHLDLSAKADAAEWQIIICSHVALDSISRPVIGRNSAVIAAYESGGQWSGGGLSYDFTGKNAATLAAYISGHVHKYSWRNINRVDSSGNILSPLQMAYISLPNALPARDETSTDGVTYTKTANSAESTAFVILTLNFEAKIIYLHHYGAGIDVILHYSPLAAPGGAILTSSLTAPVTWASNDTAIATVTGGIVIAVSAGPTMIWAKSEADGCVEAWNVAVTV